MREKAPMMYRKLLYHVLWWTSPPTPAPRGRGGRWASGVAAGNVCLCSGSAPALRSPLLWERGRGEVQVRACLFLCVYVPYIDD
jgi:hypothetical protein